MFGDAPAMDACRWTPTQDELNAIGSRATAQLLLTTARVTWVSLPNGADSLGPPNIDGFVCVGWTVASGDRLVQDRDVWWHVDQREGRLRINRAS